MSTFAVNELCYRTVREPAFRAALLASPDAVLATLDLTGEERTALRSGDVGRLYLLGANTYMLGHLSRFKLFGLTQRGYAESMWAAARSRGEAVGADKR